MTDIAEHTLELIFAQENPQIRAQQLRAFGAEWHINQRDAYELAQLALNYATLQQKDSAEIVTELLLGFTAALEEQRYNQWQNNILSRVQRLDGIHRIISAANSTLDMDASLQTVVDTVAEVMDVDVCSVYVFDQHTRILKLRATHGLSPRAIGAVEIKLGVGITGASGEIGKPIAVPDVRNDPRYNLEPLLEETDYLSLLAVPIILFSNERLKVESLQGVISVQTHEPFNFPPDMISYLEVVAGEIALSIANAQLFQQTDARLHQKIRELTTLQRVTAALASTLDEGVLLSLIVEQAVKIAGVDRVDIFQIGGSNRPRLQASFGPGRSSGVEELVMQVVDERRVIAVPNAYTDDRWAGIQSLAYREGFHSVFAVPMRISLQVVGALCFYSYATRYIQYEEMQLLSTFADEAAIAIQNAHLYEETQRNLTIKSTLLQEIHHRIRNNLQTISALLQMQARRLPPDNEGRAAMEDSIQRIHSIAAVHNLLSNNDLGQTTVQEIGKQVLEIAQMTVSDEMKIAIEVTGKPLAVNSRAATLLAIVINELVQNAIFYGMGDSGGLIAIDAWLSEHLAYVQVRDDGPTRPAINKRRTGTGLGLNIIETLVNTDLGGKFEFKRDEEWTRAIIEFAPAVFDE